MTGCRNLKEEGKMIRRSVFFVVALSLLAGPDAIATDYFVSGATGSDSNVGTLAFPLRTITRGLTIALSGDTVFVMNGEYTRPKGEVFPLVIRGGVHLVGYGAEKTTINAINASPRRRVIQCDGTATQERQTIIRGFTIIGGRESGAPNDPSPSGGGIACRASALGSVVIEENIIAFNHVIGASGAGATGGAVYGESVLLRNNVFAHNYSQGGAGTASVPDGGSAYGGAVRCDRCEVFHNTFDQNAVFGGDGFTSGPFGAGGWSAGAGFTGELSTVINNIFTRHTAKPGTSAPGALVRTGYNAAIHGDFLSTIDHNLFSGNSGSAGASDGTTGTNPLFSDPKYLSNLVRVAYESPARRAGSTATLSVVSDMYGRPRPSPPTIGAVEASRKVRGDFDGDGRSDLFWESSGHALAIWFMNLYSIFGGGSPPLDPGTLELAGIEDFNGDSYADLLWRDPATGVVSVWLMQNVNVIDSGVVATPGAAWSVHGVGDFNGDGRADVLIRNATTSAVGVWFLNGRTLTSATLYALLGTDWSVQGIGYFNADDTADIMWRNSATNDVAIWEMNGAAAPVGYLFGVPVDPAWRIAGLADFSGDGMSDAIWVDPVTGFVTLWQILNGGLGSYTALPSIAGTHSLRALGDFDRDGVTDMVWRDGAGNNEMWQMRNSRIYASGSIARADTSWFLLGPR
jgi:hypothetical protein